MQFVYFFFFTGLVGLLTFIFTRGRKDESLAGYFLAGRALTGGVIAGSLLLTNLSTEQLVGLNGAAFKDGLSVMAWEVVAAMSLVVMALFFLPKFLRSGIATVPQFLEVRYDHGTRVITTYIFIIAYAAILLPIVLYTGATGLNSMLDVEGLTGLGPNATLWLTVWLVGVLGSIYAIFGGLKSVAFSDTINGFGLVVGGVLITMLGLKAIAGESGGVMDGWRILQDANPDKFQSFGNKDQSVPWHTLFTGVLLLNLFYWCTNQQIIQRTFGARNLKEGQKGVLIAGCFKVIAPLILVIPGIIAFHLYGRAMHNGVQLAIENISSGDVTLLAKDAGGANVIITAADQNVDGAASLESAKSLIGSTITFQDKSYEVNAALEADVLLASDASGELVEIRGEDPSQFVSMASVDKAYGKLVSNVLPKSLVGFFAAVMIGAILSSFNSALNSTATLFSLGVYQSQFHPTADDQTVVRAGKVCGIIVAVVAMSVAPLLKGQESIFGYLQKMNGIYFIPIFAVVLAGLIHRRVPAWAARWAVGSGVVLIAIGYFVTPELVEQVHEFHFLGITFAALMAFLLIAGTVAPRKDAWVQQDSGDVDLTPWRGAVPMGVALIIVVLSIYASFA